LTKRKIQDKGKKGEEEKACFVGFGRRGGQDIGIYFQEAINLRSEELEGDAGELEKKREVLPIEWTLKNVERNATTLDWGGGGKTKERFICGGSECGRKRKERDLLADNLDTPKGRQPICPLLRENLLKEEELER